MENQDTQQNKSIAFMRTDINWIKNELKDMKAQIFNHIPTSIKKLEDKINDNELANSKWRTSILVAVILVMLELLAGFVLNYFK